MKTKQDKLKELIEKLGMQVEMQPLLDSDSEAYGRFEKAVDNILDRYNGRTPPYIPCKKTSVTYDTWPILSCFQKEIWRKTPHIRDSVKYVKDFSGAAHFFKQYYGIKGEPVTIREISEQASLSRGRVSDKISFVFDVLKRNHKRDLWYGTL